MRVVCAAILLGVSGLLTTACTPEFIEQNQTTLLMRVTDIVGNAASADDGDILLSDVSDGFNDDATVTVDLARKNPIVGVSTPLEDVRLERYEVRFFRTDGRNTEGVDVPYRFTGPLNQLLHAPAGVEEQATEVVVSIVRHQAKFEPPLRNLIGVFGENLSVQFGGAGIITTIAEITIHGRSLAGHGLSATGRLQVTFADFADQ